MLKLLHHHWKETQRSPYWQKSIPLNIFLGLLGLYMWFSVLAIGYFADKIIQEIFQDKEVIEIFSGLLVYYFAFDLFIRFLFQKLPVVSIQPYLLLPLRKSKLLHLPLLKSTTSFFNVLAIFLFLPFFVKVVCESQTSEFSAAWGIALLSLIFLNNFLNFSLKKYFSERPLLILFLLVLAGLLLYLDIREKIPLSDFFSKGLLFAANKPLMTLVPVGLTLLSYWIAYNLLRKNSYIEDAGADRQKKTPGFSFLGRYGEIGSLLRVELKMIFRNKRPKTLLFLSPIFLLYGFLLYKPESLDNYLVLIFAGLIVTSASSINYGQFVFSWESSYFDSYVSNNISPLNYIKSKYILFTIASVGCFILTLPYGLMGYKIVYVNAAMLLYSLGVSSFIMIYFCTFNTSRIDLGKGQFMNYQGTGFAQFLMIIPIFGLPVIMFLIFDYFGIPQYSIYSLGIAGAFGILFKDYLLQRLTDQFLKKKHKMALGFRNN